MNEKEKPQKIKVYNMDDCTWYAAESLESAIEQYQEDCDGAAEDDIKEYAHELDDEQMKSHRYYTNGELKIWHPFSRQLEVLIEQGTEFPCFFATEEF